MLNDDFQNHSIIELDHIYTIMNEIIENLDDVAINEILQGNIGDIDNLFKTMFEETVTVLMMDKTELNPSSTHYLTNVTNCLDDYLKKKSLNYFVATTLPTFDLQWFHIEWFNFVTLYRLLCIESARGHGKSYSFSWAYILWKMYRYDRPTSLRPIIPLETKLCKEGMLITNEFKLARKLLKKVREEIVANDILAKKLKPEGRGDGFGNDSLTCKNGAQLDLSSFHSSNRGPHPGYIVLDDFLDKSALYSNEQREKFWEVFTAEISNMLLPNGQMCVVGTPFASNDLYGRLKEDERWKVFEYPAIFPDGRVLYPERFPFNELMALKKSLGTLIFTREILVKPVSDISSIFPYPNCLNNSIIGMQTLKLVDNIQSFPMKFKKISVGADFAISGNIAADFTVYTVWGINSLDEYYLLHVFRGQGLSHHQQISELQRINSNFQPDVIVAEANGFQRVMIQLAKESGIKNIQEFMTDGWNKKDLYEGLPGLAVLFERGSIKMPYGDEHSKNMVNLIHSEFNSITFNDDNGKLEASSGHDDTAMSAFFGIKGINQINNELRISLI